MAKAKKTIEGLVFECEVCGQRFAVGTRGIEAITERVQKHVMENHANGVLEVAVSPIKPVKGLTYAGGNISHVYDGEEDWKEFLNKVRESARLVGMMAPQMALTK